MEGPDLWIHLPSATIVESWAHTLGRSPSLSPTASGIHEKENTFCCLWFMVFPSGTLLVDSLNCPSRAKHTPLKKSIHTSLFFFFSVLEYVFWWSVFLHYEGKWWGVSYYTPLAGIGFYFPEEYLCSVKTLIKNLQWVVKRFICVAAAVTTVIFSET